MSHWMNRLPGDVLNRLAACHTIRKDLPILVGAKWYAMKEAGKDKSGFTREDALISVLELCDANGRYFDLSREEYDELAYDPFAK